MKHAIAAITSGITYLLLPDILTPIETVMLLIGLYASMIALLLTIEEQIEAVRTGRERLKIRKPGKDRSGKIVDFRLKSRAIHIPAYKVGERREA